MSKKRLPGQWVDAEDYTEYEREHRRIFGHTPIVDVTGRTLCAHPQHDAMQALIEMPGVHAELGFRFADRRHDDFLTEDEYDIRPEFRG